MDDKDMILQTAVIAGNDQQYETWLRASRADPNLYIYISYPGIFKGQRFRDIIYLGTFFERKDFHDILAEIAPAVLYFHRP